MKHLEQVLKLIAIERNMRLDRCKDVTGHKIGSYDFTVAHGLTEAIRIIDRYIQKAGE